MPHTVIPGNTGISVYPAGAKVWPHKVCNTNRLCFSRDDSIAGNVFTAGCSVDPVPELPALMVSEPCQKNQPHIFHAQKLPCDLPVALPAPERVFSPPVSLAAELGQQPGYQGCFSHTGCANIFPETTKSYLEEEVME